MDSTTTAHHETAQPSSHATSTGLDENVAAALTYVLGWLTGIVFYFIESENDRVRFHAAQSIVVFGGITVLTFVISFIQAGLAVGGPRAALGFGFLSMILALVSTVVWLAAVATWVFLLVRTYQGNDPRIPGAAGIADRIA